MNSRRQDGVILVMTIVLLVVLSTLAYMITTRVARQQHRDEFMVDYTKARYGCDSAVRYALASLEDLDNQLISRPNEPDFSDVFAMTDEQLEIMLDEWGLLVEEPAEGMETGMESDGLLGAIMGLTDGNDPDAATMGMAETYDPNDPTAMSDQNAALPKKQAAADLIRGPYGPPWPLVTEASEFVVGDVNVTIEIEDENAKYPIGWALLGEDEISRESEASFDTFCEWMALDSDQISELREELALIAEMKPFKTEFKAISKLVKTPVPTTANAPAPGSSRTSTRLTRATRSRTTKKTISAADQIARQSSDFGKLLHSAMLDRDKLARPSSVSEKRQETPLRYMSLWGTRRVNINTAPRHVLEALFMFGGDSRQIAEAIIQHRRIEPFKNMDELTEALFSYADSLRACEGYITFASTVFTIRVKATSGTATASSTIAITREGKKVKRIAVLNG